MYVIVATQEERAASLPDYPSWIGKDIAVSPAASKLPREKRLEIADALEVDWRDGDGWTLFFDPVSAGDWPERFAAGVARCIDELRKS